MQTHSLQFSHSVQRKLIGERKDWPNWASHGSLWEPERVLLAWLSWLSAVSSAPQPCCAAFSRRPSSLQGHRPEFWAQASVVPCYVYGICVCRRKKPSEDRTYEVTKVPPWQAVCLLLVPVHELGFLIIPGKPIHLTDRTHTSTSEWSDGKKYTRMCKCETRKF